MNQDASELITQAEQLFEEKKFDEIIALLPDNLLDNLKSAALYAWRARAHEKINEIELAFVFANRAINIDPLFAMSYFVRANGWYEKKEYDSAIKDFSKAINLNENYIVAFLNRGNAWFNKQEYDKAIEDYNKVIDLDEKYADAIYNRGLAWHDKKEHEKAIQDYNEVIKLNENDADAYYARAITNEAVQEFSKAIDDYNIYIQLTNNPKNYYSQIAKDAIKELEKKIANIWYKEIDEIITNIKNLLLFKQDCVTHYTSLSAAKAMILGIKMNTQIERSKFRLSEGAFLNDTSEGRELFDYLNFSNIKKADKTLAEPFTEKPFIGSFVTETKHDDLTLWRMYGKENMVEARGCALTINKDKFLSALKDSVNDKTKENTIIETQEQFTFYKVAYIKKDGESEFFVPGDEAAGNELNILMKELKEKIEKLTDEQKTEVNKLLNDIAYLFKSIEYQYENEIRLIVQGVGFEKTIEIDANPPRVYLQTIDIVPVLTKITFGPKVERADEWAAAFNYHIKKEIRDSNIPIIISHLPFK